MTTEEMAGLVASGAVVVATDGVLRVVSSPGVVVGAESASDLIRYEKYWADLASKPGTLSDRAARAFYLSEEARIPSLLDHSLPLESQARQAFEMRNELRIRTRDLMADREFAELLNRTEPNMTWNQVVDKYSGNYSGDALWEKIINSSQASRSSVNQKLGF
jgi:filamentous hemagglutinin